MRFLKDWRISFSILNITNFNELYYVLNFVWHFIYIYKLLGFMEGVSLGRKNTNEIWAQSHKGSLFLYNALYFFYNIKSKFSWMWDLFPHINIIPIIQSHLICKIFFSYTLYIFSSFFVLLLWVINFYIQGLLLFLW